MEKITLYHVIKEIELGILRTESNFDESSLFARKCGKAACDYCTKLGRAKATFAKTKLMFSDMIHQLKIDSAPRAIFDQHVRKEYGNYQAWILVDGHYVNVWKIGGHSLFAEICKNDHDISRIKVHAQGGWSNIIFYNSNTPPTQEQMATLFDLVADSVMWNYCLNFSFAYDAHHPDPVLLDEIPF